MDIMVSICCLVYNHEKYLRKTLEGFVRQKVNFNYEIIIHDDASTDSSAAIIREYCEKYPGLFHPILQTENQHSKRVYISNYMPGELNNRKSTGKACAFLRLVTLCAGIARNPASGQVVGHKHAKKQEIV